MSQLTPQLFTLDIREEPKEVMETGYSKVDASRRLGL